jgi:hypothetical protein
VDRRKDVSRELTEVRTVLSRAETAASTIEWLIAERAEFPERTYLGETDPDAAEMMAALDSVVTLLEPWRRG